MSKRRKELGKYEGQRIRIRATFERFGTKSGFKGPEKTILLKDIQKIDEDVLLADHLWFTCGKTFDRLNLHTGDTITFNARVSKYEKGYQGRRAEETGEVWWDWDYRLERPTKAIRENSVK